jgi:LysR family cys regulon transcriptional activator
MLVSGEADIGIATQTLAEQDALVALSCYRWTHAVVVPQGHELLEGPLTLQRLAAYPLITYDVGYTGRGTIDDAFRRAGLHMQLVLSAMDADVIKTYVGLGMGVGIVASIAFDDERDRPLHAIDARHLFAINTTSVAVRRGALLRAYAYDFIQAFAPHLKPDIVMQAQAARSADAQPAPL